MFFLSEAMAGSPEDSTDAVESCTDSAVLVRNPAKGSAKPVTLNHFLSEPKTEYDFINTPSTSIKAKKPAALAPKRLAPTTSAVKFRNSGLQKSPVSKVTATDDVSKKIFHEDLAANYIPGNRASKPEWTRDRIEKVITIIENHRTGRERNANGYHYAKKYDVIVLGDKKFLIRKRRKDQDSFIQIVPSEDYFDILTQVHLATCHGGRDKMISALKSEFVIPTPAITIFVKHCKVCQAKRRLNFKRNGAIPEILCNRGKIDLIDMQKTPDGEYKWILHYQDGVTKFSFLRALTSDSLDEVASELLKLFLEIGCPPILETTRSRTFTSALIKELEQEWPVCKILNGKHEPDELISLRDQIKKMLRVWMCERSSENWSIGIYFVQYQKNTAKNNNTGLTPFKELFGRIPKVGVKNLQLKSIIDKADMEEELEQLINQFKKDKRESCVETNSTHNDNFPIKEESDTLNIREITISESSITSSGEVKQELEECQEIDPLPSTSAKAEDTEIIKELEEDEKNIKSEQDSPDEVFRLDSSEDDDCIITDIKQEFEIEISVDEEGVKRKKMKITL